MKGVMDFITSQPIAVMGIAFFSLLAIYFIFKQLLKLALFIMLIVLAVVGYYYFKDPKKMPENLRQTIQETQRKSGEILETGKRTYQAGKQIYEKGKEITKEAGELFLKDEEKEKKSP
jgi:hypothetical protein